MDISGNDIRTPRLRLRLMDQATLEACLMGDLETAGHLLQAKIPAELLDHPSSLTYNLKQLEADPLYLPWSARAILLPEEAQMIGLVRFHTSPDPAYLHPWVRNAVEFGYQIFTPWRRQHYATETLTAILQWAETHYGIQRFVASVSPDNIPSLNLIANLGFTRIGETIDETDGEEYIFLRSPDH